MAVDAGASVDSQEDCGCFRGSGSPGGSGGGNGEGGAGGDGGGVGGAGGGGTSGGKEVAWMAMVEAVDMAEASVEEVVRRAWRAG